jgi:hypothetical protein
MQLKRLPLALLFVMPVIFAKGQNNTVSADIKPVTKSKFTSTNDSLPTRITFQPFYFAIHALRLSYDRKIKEGKWIEISPLFFLSEKSGQYDDYSKLSGLGGMVYYKHFVSRTQRNSGVYVGMGAMFNYLWFEYPLYTSSFSSSGDQEYLKTSFAKLGGDLIFGYDFMFASGKLTGGVYGGFGFRYANTDNQIMKHRFNEAYWDYAFSGNILLVGLKVGAAF